MVEIKDILFWIIVLFLLVVSIYSLFRGILW